MKDQDKTKEQLIAELDELRGGVSAWEAAETEWHRTEDALQESEERFRLLVEAIPQPIWRSDADGNVMEFNRRWHEYTGQTAAEAKGSGWTKAVHSDEAAMVVQKVRAGITSGVAIEIVNRLRRASDGSYRWHLARAIPMRPPILDESGVVAAIVHLVYDPAFDQGPKIDFRNRVKFKRLAPILENVIYRIVQEGLNNARNHGKSKKIRVSLKQRGDRLRIEIRDWGVGFDPKIVQDNHFGLEGIRERARLLGGNCSIKSKPCKGTAIVVELPVVERESEK